MSKHKKSKKNNVGNKPKKEKIVYIDDNSTIADMSGTAKFNDRDEAVPRRKRSTFKDKARTYFSTVRKMLIPMFITLIAFTLAYFLLLLAAGKI